MPIWLACLGVIAVWSTTPLAITWSGQGAGFMFGVSSRMLLALMLMLLFLAILRHKIIWHSKACWTYLYGGLGLYGGMMTVYWGAQYINSGWIAVLFGLTPIYSAIMASWWLHNEPLTRPRIIGMFIGLSGLAVIFGSGLSIREHAILGLLAVMLSGIIQSASAVLIKRVDAQIPALSTNTGSLLCATPLFLLTWYFSTPHIDTAIQHIQLAPNYTLLSIAYLALFGSVLGFSLYFYVLQHIQATRVALISMLTPVTALLLGHYLNHEAITMNILMGSACILLGLAVFEWGGSLRKRQA